MPVDQSSTKVVLKHPKGASTEILLYGASVISWKSPSKGTTEPVERLFVSSKAFLDGSKPVRGGIPVVFPAFGAPTHAEHSKLSQHGFARSENWIFDSVVMDNEAGVSVRLKLEPTASIQAVYNKPFSLAYVVTLAEHQLSTDLHVENPADASGPLEFQALLHNYIAAPAEKVLVSPLHGLSYIDKTDVSFESSNALKTETREGVDVRKFTDSVYVDAPGNYKVVWPGGGVEIKTKGFKDVVVWNPQETGTKIGDMELQGWAKYICVEPGYVRGFNSVAPGNRWIGQQVISVIDPQEPSSL